MNKRIAPVFIISILWAFIFNISKKATEFSDDVKTLVFFKTILIGIIGIIALIIYQYKNKEILDKIRNIDNRIIYLFIFSVLLEILSSYYYFYSLKNNQLSWVIPLIEAGIILFSILLSLLFFKEELNASKFFGIILIIIGIYLVYNN